MSWILLFLAIGCEILATVFMKISNGFSQVIPSILMGIFYILSFIFLTFSLKEIDVSIAYAIWSGVGTAVIALIGVFLFKEQINFTKTIAIFLIIGGVVLFNMNIGPR